MACAAAAAAASRPLLLLLLLLAHLAGVALGDSRFSSFAGYLSPTPSVSSAISVASCLDSCASSVWCHTASVFTGGTAQCLLFGVGPNDSNVAVVAAAQWTSYELLAYAAPCSAGYYYSIALNACMVLSQCAAGTHIVAAATPVSDVQCAACPAGFYQPLAGQLVCIAASVCPAQYLQVAASTPTSDTACVGPMVVCAFQFAVDSSPTTATALFAVTTLYEVSLGISASEAASYVSVSQAPAANKTLISVNNTIPSALATQLFASMCAGTIRVPWGNYAIPIPTSSIQPPCSVQSGTQGSSSSSSSSSSASSTTVAIVSALLATFVVAQCIVILFMVRRRREGKANINIFRLGPSLGSANASNRASLSPVHDITMPYQKALPGGDDEAFLQSSGVRFKRSSSLQVTGTKSRTGSVHEDHKGEGDDFSFEERPSSKRRERGLSESIRSNKLRTLSHLSEEDQAAAEPLRREVRLSLRNGNTPHADGVKSPRNSCSNSDKDAKTDTILGNSPLLPATTTALFAAAAADLTSPTGPDATSRKASMGIAATPELFAISPLGPATPLRASDHTHEAVGAAVSPTAPGSHSKPRTKRPSAQAIVSQWQNRFSLPDGNTLDDFEHHSQLVTLLQQAGDASIAAATAAATTAATAGAPATAAAITTTAPQGETEAAAAADTTLVRLSLTDTMSIGSNIAAVGGSVASIHSTAMGAAPAGSSAAGPSAEQSPSKRVPNHLEPTAARGSQRRTPRSPRSASLHDKPAHMVLPQWSLSPRGSTADPKHSFVEVSPRASAGTAVADLQDEPPSRASNTHATDQERLSSSQNRDGSSRPSHAPDTDVLSDEQSVGETGANGAVPAAHGLTQAALTAHSHSAQQHQADAGAEVAMRLSLEHRHEKVSLAETNPRLSLGHTFDPQVALALAAVARQKQEPQSPLQTAVGRASDRKSDESLQQQEAPSSINRRESEPAEGDGVGGQVGSVRPGSQRRQGQRRASLLGNSCTNAADIGRIPLTSPLNAMNPPSIITANSQGEPLEHECMPAPLPAHSVIAGLDQDLPSSRPSLRRGYEYYQQPDDAANAGDDQVTPEPPTPATPVTPTATAFPARMSFPCTVPPMGPPPQQSDSPLDQRTPEWVYKDLSRAEACSILLEPPWSGQQGCFLVRRKEKGMYVISVVGKTRQVAHYLLNRTSEAWIVQNLADRPCAAATTPLSGVVNILRDPIGKWRMNLARMVHPLAPALET